MEAVSVTKKLTYEDYVLFDDDGMQHELIDGEHYASPSPVTKHQKIVLNLAWVFRNFLVKNSVGEIFVAPYDVLFSPVDTVRPDLIYVSGEKSYIITEKNIQGSPDLLIEILSPTHPEKDKVIKKSLYERNKVGEYWIVDPDKEVVEVYLLTEKGVYNKAKTYTAKETITTRIIPGLEVNLNEVFP